MAVSLLNSRIVCKKIQDDFFIKSAGFVRNASRTGDLDHLSRGINPNCGLKRNELENVNAGTTLYQHKKFSFCPGLNVAIGGRGNLYAKVAGKVLFSYEKTNFKPDAECIQKTFPHYTVPYKTYINVIPEPLHKRFKLIDKI